MSPGDAAELEQDLRAQATEQLRAGRAAWEFHRREGTVAPELIATATAVGEAHPNDTVAIIVGSSSNATRRMVELVAVHLSPSPVILMIVPQTNSLDRQAGAAGLAAAMWACLRLARRYFTPSMARKAVTTAIRTGAVCSAPI